ncbi:MAG: threonine synthase [Vallitaleaceae bacterium]|jgi:threonine synthase|nr:threonine synthase [Vallitaleaceae bacterium]
MVVYNSTRGAEESVQASYAIVKGLASDGGLFVPSEIPTLDIELSSMLDMTYQEVAYEVMSRFYSDFTKEELMYCITSAYDDKFDTPIIAPVVKKGAFHYLELFHGSTIAFKDMALSILPYLMKVASKKMKLENDIVILTATSGDTGKAALAGFADVAGTKIIVFYPKDGVSPIQKHQMLTQKGDNTFVVGIDGNFDDAQNGVKAIFNDTNYKKKLSEHGYQFSSANSINIGRLIPQVAYYVYAYLSMVKSGDITLGESINVTVPTGNFGNILAAYYAKNMGLPFNQLICASNDNKVLYDFINTGTYDRRRDFILTSSPSMDILISSNLERLIYEITDMNPKSTRDMMTDLVRNGYYHIDEEMQHNLINFYGNFADDEETYTAIKEVFTETNYLLDPHTAVGYSVAKKYGSETNDSKKMLIVSTASPYKFTKSVMHAIDATYDSKDDFELVKDMETLSKVSLPRAVSEILGAKVLHKTECKSSEMIKVINEYLGI